VGESHPQRLRLGARSRCRCGRATRRCAHGTGQWYGRLRLLRGAHRIGRRANLRGALDCGARQISEQMKVAAAEAIAGCISDDELHEDYIIPSVFNRTVASKVAAAVIQVARDQGLARREVNA